MLCKHKSYMHSVIRIRIAKKESNVSGLIVDDQQVEKVFICRFYINLLQILHDVRCYTAFVDL